MCEVWSYPLGFEFRAIVGAELVQAHVCWTRDGLIREHALNESR